jgi:hypothetical protein
MGRDIFVQDLPPTISSVGEIPDDFEPRPIGARSRVIAVLRRLAPSASFDDPSGIVIVKPEAYHIEVNLGSDEELRGFAFHVAGGLEADALIARILSELHLRALEPASESGLFVPPTK